MIQQRIYSRIPEKAIFRECFLLLCLLQLLHIDGVLHAETLEL